MAQLPNLPHELRSVQVLVRFFLRMAILVAFAAVGAIRRELPFDNVLNHWDEMMAYVALCCLVSGFNQAVPV